MSGVSGKQLDVLVTGLESTDLVRALRGTSGGHVLTRDPSTITALDVMPVFEGKTASASSMHPHAAVSSRCAARGVEV